ncbi:Leucyl-tRNA synthetase, partial [hydrothermal vent metagenome]
PPEKDLEWNDKGVDGASRFLNKVYRFVDANRDLLKSHTEPKEALNQVSRDLERKTHQCVKKFSTDIENNFHFNTCISAVMELTNLLLAAPNNDRQEKAEPHIIKQSVTAIIKLLYPMVPHFCAELWEMTGHDEPLDQAAWPEFDPQKAKEDEITIVIQVKGKVRSRLQVSIGISDDELREMAVNDEKTKKFIGDNPIKKIIVVKNKLINIVI